MASGASSKEPPGATRPIQHKQGPGRGSSLHPWFLPTMFLARQAGKPQRGLLPGRSPLKDKRTQRRPGRQASRESRQSPVVKQRPARLVHCSDALNHNRAGGAEQPQEVREGTRVLIGKEEPRRPWRWGWGWDSHPKRQFCTSGTCGRCVCRPLSQAA